MDEPAPPPAKVPNDRTFVGWLRDMPRWKKIAVGVAVAAVVVGAALTLAAPAPPVGGSTGGTSPGIASSLTAGNPSPHGSTTVGEEPAAKGVFRLGFGFVAGFCLGSFVRAMLKVAAIAFGFWLAMTLVLAHYGLVVVDWTAIDGVWNRFTQNVADEWSSFQRFVTGSLPTAGLAVTGLAIGLKRH